ncbi:hypothetical protein CAPTEDRAFT_102231 [Capitella teleta]|uniref:NADP-dependent oxidoreductase domain-containing protein n=1 Tax=Capitella teleta TaxID=283909 RepID=R7V2S6_CAPTE|nr:hypothetical protein CAPTEDRAFT_102231 [Capitella teleta]|eukprot:ELU12777.1 hypothetical protein CAPTEDRAFT_102231 [Capitella teleta]
MTAAHIAKSLTSTVTLNDGVIMPLFGYGTYKLNDNKQETEKVVLQALKCGHRLLDTAQFYKNEEEVGTGVRKSGLNRKDIFVVTKVWFTNMGREKCIESVNESLKKLDIEYIDLILMHTPCKNGKSVETYTALQEFKEKGLVRSVGVSNFGIQHIEGLIAAGCPLPSVNQIELNTYFRQKEIVDYCRKKNIAVMGFSPLAKAKKGFENEVITSIANKHKKSVAQVMIRWSVQNGFITIPKSSREERINENADVFDFSLEETDLAAIVSIGSYRC